MGVIANIAAGGTTHKIASTAYAVCSTAGSTAAKVAILSGFTLIEGITVHIRFTEANTANNPTLNINNTGAKPIYGIHSMRVGNDEFTSWSSGSVISLTYTTTMVDTGSWFINDYADFKKYVHWQSGDQISLENTYISALAYSSKYVEGSFYTGYALENDINNCTLSGGKVAIYGANGQILAPTATYPSYDITGIVRSTGKITVKFTMSSNFSANNNNKPAVIWFDSGAKATIAT